MSDLILAGSGGSSSPGQEGRRSLGDILTFARNVESAVTGSTFTLVFLMIAAPIAYVLYGSFLTGQYVGEGTALTTEHWQTVYGTAAFLRPFVNTLLLTATVAFCSVLLGTIMAWIVARTNTPGRRKLAPLLVVTLMGSHL